MEMEGEKLVTDWCRHGNTVVSRQALKFEANYLQSEPDEIFCQEY